MCILPRLGSQHLAVRRQCHSRMVDCCAVKLRAPAIASEQHQIRRSCSLDLVIFLRRERHRSTASRPATATREIWTVAGRWEDRCMRRGARRSDIAQYLSDSLLFASLWSGFGTCQLGYPYRPHPLRPSKCPVRPGRLSAHCQVNSGSAPVVGVQ